MDFPLPVRSYSVPSLFVGLLDPENMRVAVGILSLGGREPDIRWGYFNPPITTYVCKKDVQQQG